VTLSAEVPGEGRLSQRLVAVAAVAVHKQSSIKEPSGPYRRKQEAGYPLCAYCRYTVHLDHANTAARV
jgi:hypothetical protein